MRKPPFRRKSGLDFVLRRERRREVRQKEDLVAENGQFSSGSGGGLGF